jgi:hypothetical protein
LQPADLGSGDSFFFFLAHFQRKHSYLQWSSEWMDGAVQVSLCLSRMWIKTKIFALGDFMYHTSYIHINLVNGIKWKSVQGKDWGENELFTLVLVRGILTSFKYENRNREMEVDFSSQMKSKRADAGFRLKFISTHKIISPVLSQSMYFIIVKVRENDVTDKRQGSLIKPSVAWYFWFCLKRGLSCRSWSHCCLWYWKQCPICPTLMCLI